MEMEVEETAAAGAMEQSSTSADKNAVIVFCITKKNGLKKAKVPVDNFTDLKLEDLKTKVLYELLTWEWPDDNDKPKKIDILHNSRVLKSDDDVKRIGPLSLVTAIKKVTEAPKMDHKSSEFIVDYANSRGIKLEMIKSCSLSLRTAFLHPKFITMIENLGDSDMMENIMAMVPELKNDPVAIGIIQDPILIFHLSDPEALRKVAATKPWIIEAFNFITASIHQEKSHAPPELAHQLFNSAIFDGDDDDMMNDGDEDDDEPGPSNRGAGASSRITREQLAAALSALGGGGMPTAGLPSSNSNSFGGLFQSGPTPPASAGPPPPQPTPAAPNPVAAAGANIQNLMNTFAGAGGGIPGQPLNSDVVARAITDALRRLTPEQRADQMNAIRTFANQIQQQSTENVTTGLSQPSQNPAPASTVQQPPQASGNASGLAQQYQAQLRQMRDLGISDERLSILALQVSEGDVNTAAELIFSGWQGEGSDAMD